MTLCKSSEKRDIKIGVNVLKYQPLFQLNVINLLDFYCLIFDKIIKSP